MLRDQRNRIAIGYAYSVSRKHGYTTTDSAIISSVSVSDNVAGGLFHTSGTFLFSPSFSTRPI